MADDEPDDRTERWRLAHDGAQHVLAITAGSGLKRTFRWTVDGDEVAEKRTSDDRFTLVADGRPLALAIRMATFGDSARRVSLFEADNTAIVHATAATGIGGIELDPDPGTKAARRNEKMATHPWRYTAQRTVTAIATIVLPLLFFWLLAQVLGALPKPDVDLPDIPLPDVNVDLPDIPWPDLDLPSLDLPDLPGWTKPIRDAAPYVVPVLIAFAIARVEVRRRRQALEQRRRRGDAPSPDATSASPAAGNRSEGPADATVDDPR